MPLFIHWCGAPWLLSQRQPSSPIATRWLPSRFLMKPDISPTHAFRMPPGFMPSRLQR